MNDKQPCNHCGRVSLATTGTCGQCLLAFWNTHGSVVAVEEAIKAAERRAMESALLSFQTITMTQAAAIAAGLPPAPAPVVEEPCVETEWDLL